jgi:hypothetical protein
LSGHLDEILKQTITFGHEDLRKFGLVGSQKKRFPHVTRWVFDTPYFFCFKKKKNKK